MILLDDAYQHRSVKAGMNILITDYAHPFYDDHILPFGSLRESRTAYKRAEIVIVSKCPLNLTGREAKNVEKLIDPQPHQKVFFTTIRYDTPYDIITREPASLHAKNIILVCGIARPQPLISFLEGNAHDVHTLTYSDHHYFVTSDLEEIKETYDNWKVSNKIIVTTEKDAARLYLHIEKLKAWSIPVVVLPITISVLFDQGKDLDNLLTRYVEKTIQENGPQEIETPSA